MQTRQCARGRGAQFWSDRYGFTRATSIYPRITVTTLSYIPWPTDVVKGGGMGVMPPERKKNSKNMVKQRMKTSWPGPRNSGTNPRSFCFLGRGYFGTTTGTGYPPVRNPGYVSAMTLQWTEWAERGLIQQQKIRNTCHRYHTQGALSRWRKVPFQFCRVPLTGPWDAVKIRKNIPDTNS